MPPLFDPERFSTSNHTLSPRDRVCADPKHPSHPYDPQTRCEGINNLPGGLRFASSDIAELLYAFIIRRDDPNAGGFAGRWAGGGRRLDIYGNSRYGSGYPGALTEGVKGRDFPFFFHPLSYGRYPGYGPAYIYNHEYGEPENGRRPGGPLYFIVIRPPTSLTQGPHPPMTLYITADKPTLKVIGPRLRWSCSSSFSMWGDVDKARVSKLKKFKGPAEDPNGPVPEEAVEYYRGSSVALFLAGYNNTAQVIDYIPCNHTNLVDTPLPPVADTQFFQCVNKTLGESIPLVVGWGAAPYQRNAASSMSILHPGIAMLLALVFVAWRRGFRT